MVNDSEPLEFNPFGNSVKCYNQLRNDTHPRKNVQKGIKYSWDSKIQGLILSSVYYGFFFTQLPGGILSERIGAKWIYGSGVLISNVLYMLLPFSASLGYEVFIAVRIIEGFAEGLTFPAINFAISNWSPKSERSRISSIIFLGIPFGMIIGMTVSGVLSSTEFLGGWPSTFYLFGSCGILWFIFWSTLVYETPKDHPYISAEELAYIQDGQTESFTVKPVVPWKDIFSSLPVWAVIIAHLGNAYALDGLLSAIPYVCQIVSSAASSYIADRLRMSNKISITSIRKIMNINRKTSIYTNILLYVERDKCFIGPALCLLGIVASGCQQILILVLLCSAMFLNGFIYSGYNVTHVDMSPEFAGVLYGITCTIANAGGIASPEISGVITASGDPLQNWNLIFCITSAVYFASGVFYAVFASAEKQPWSIVGSDVNAYSILDDENI
ncbi:putative inorganic phosphate cotransporter [Caerostris darwini]|uniref:Inorganic phosphate cotransporter n=1 Tax=Caerostris darwini TaxID=1538125 RepID=A0AAV4NGM5_9ARAC|nr:putative inorganic phosphate cotransporter [Caerostris darwini]